LKDSAGNILTGRTITWASSGTAIATVSGSGLVSGVASGSATITATSGGKKRHHQPYGSVVRWQSVSVSPATASVLVGATVQLAATTKDASGNTLTGRSITWSSGNTGIATVSASGLVTGISAGSATNHRHERREDRTASITVAAAPPPGSSQFGHVFIVTEEEHRLRERDRQLVDAVPQQPRESVRAGDAILCRHPSVDRNYFELVTGQIITNNDSYSTDRPRSTTSCAGLLAAGKTSGSPTPRTCRRWATTGGDVGGYARKHNVFALLSDVATTPPQRNNLVPYTQFKTDLAAHAANFSNIVAEPVQRRA